MGRNKAWKEPEDVELVRAWLDISQNPQTGTDQTADSFWYAIHKVFAAAVKEKKIFVDGDEERTVKAVKERFSELSRCCSKFTGSLHTILSLNRSGKSDSDNYNDAKKLYLEQSKDHKAFLYDTCWDILKEFPKWAMPIAGGKNEQEQLNEEEKKHKKQCRPIGVKRSKSEEADSKVISSQTKSIEIMAEAARKNSLLLEKQIEIQDTKVSIDLFSLPMDNLDEQAKEYIRLQKLIRLRKAQNEFAELNNQTQ